MDDNECLDFVDESGNCRLVLESQHSSVLPVTYIPWDKVVAGVLCKTKSLYSDEQSFEFVTKPHNDIAAQEASHTFCYICNTLVPNAYTFEHVNSAKHVSFQQIAATGLERAGKYKQMIGRETAKNSSEYFCEHCVSIIRLSNRNEHEKSQKHKTSAALDMFVNNFALFYAYDDAEGIIDPHKVKCDASDLDVALLKIDAIASEDKMEHTEDFDVVPLNFKDDKEMLSVLVKEKIKKEVNEEVKEEVIEEVKEEVIEEVKEAAINNEPEESVNEISATVSCLDNSKMPINNNNATKNKPEEANVVKSLDQYIKYLKKYGAVGLRTYASYNQHLIKIITSDDAVLFVSTINFHGFKRHRTHTQCKLCNTVVKSVARHKLSEAHMKIIAQPLQDKHCIRRLRERFSHCVLCNEVIDNTVVHTTLPKHLRKLDQSLISIGKTNKNTNKAAFKSQNASLQVYNIAPKIDITNKQLTSSETNYYCQTCDQHMHINNVDGHLAETRHLMNYKSLIFYLMRENLLNLLTCKVCHIQVKNSMQSVEKHVATPDHVANYEKFLAANKISKTNYYLYCKPCEKILNVTDELTHAECSSHNLKLAIYNKSCGDTFVNVGAIENKHGDLKDRTDVFKKNVKEGVRNKEDRSDDPKQHSSISYSNDTLSKRNVEDNKCITEASSTIFDETRLSSASHCDEESLNNSSDMKVNDIAINKTLDECLSKVNNLLLELLKLVNSPPEIHSHLQITGVKNILNCVVCRVKISHEDTEKHTNSLKHIHALRVFITANKLKFQKDNYVCYVCRINVETGQEVRHIESVEHEMRIESLKNGEYVLVTFGNKQLIDKVYNDLKVIKFENNLSESKNITVDDIHITNVKRHFCDLIDNDKQLVCVLCKKLIVNKNCEYRTHADGMNHLMNYKLLMTYHQMFQIEDGFVCGFCECIIDGNEFAHIYSEEHILRQRNDTEKRFCVTCKVSTADMDLKDHITSECHIKNISTKFYCSVCNVEMKNNEADIQHHNEGFEHKKNSTLIDKAQVVLKKKKCVCQVCEITFSRDVLRDHITSLNHIMLLHYYQLQE